MTLGSLIALLEENSSCSLPALFILIQGQFYTNIYPTTILHVIFIFRDGGFNLFHDSETGLKYLGTVRPAAGPRLFCLALDGPPGSLSVIAGGLEGVVVLWCQGASLGTAARVLRLAQGVDSASEGEDTDYDVFDAEEDDIERGEEEAVNNIRDNKSSGFCNCSLM